MQFAVVKCALSEILGLRHLFLQENNFQIRYDACHERSWSDSYLLSVDGNAVGYGSVKGKNELKDRDAIFEFYLVPPFRKEVGGLFKKLLSVSKASYVECQSNDRLLSSMLFEFTENISSDVVLFAESVTTELQNPGVVFRKRNPDDEVFEHVVEPVGEYVLTMEGKVIATGGYMLHYNYPFADLYMEVQHDHRRKGYASYLLQEVKKECYLHGRIPAGRAPIENTGSRRALLKAGLTTSGYMLSGQVKISLAHLRS